MSRAVVFAPNWVGDTVMALPVIEALAAAGRQPSVLARPHLAPLLEFCPAVAEVVQRNPDDRVTADELRRREFDEAVLLPNSFRSAWLTRRAAIPRRWGYRGNWRAPILRPAVPRPRRRGPQIADYGELLAAMGVAPPADWVPHLSLSTAAREAGRALVERTGVVGDGPLIGLFPGAEFGPSKRWPWQRFAELSRQLRRRLPGARILILVGPKETWLGVRVHEESGHLHPLAGPDLDLGRLATLLGALDVLVTNDSGPMHLAAAVGVPCVALFGPTDPGRTAPAGDGHRILYTDRWCSPCFRRRCPLVRHRCLKEIGVERVLAATVEALGTVSR
jgi:heptosyltransferase-2